MHLMIDLETLSTDPRAVILSVGAVKFSDTQILEEFYCELEVGPQMRQHNRLVSMDTISWWVGQGADARQVITGNGPKISLEEALYMLSEFIGTDAGKIEVWANGASFDLPILETAYADHELRAPWRFWNHRCYRTLKNLFPHIAAEARAEVAHNALSDARAQALHAQRLLRCATPSSV